MTWVYKLYNKKSLLCIDSSVEIMLYSTVTGRNYAVIDSDGWVDNEYLYQCQWFESID